MPEPRLPSVSPNRSRDWAPTRPTPVRPWFSKVWSPKVAVLVCASAPLANVMATPASKTALRLGRRNMAASPGRASYEPAECCSPDGQVHGCFVKIQLLFSREALEMHAFALFGCMRHTASIRSLRFT